MPVTLDLTQQVALISGGSRGIGRAICIRLASMGYNILVNYKGNKAAAEETASIVQANGMQAEALAFAGSGFRRAPVKFFPAGQETQARAWLAG